MRTTVTLDSDVEQLLHERMAAQGISFKRALNDAVRDGSTPRIDYFFETPTHDMGIAVDLTHANRLLDEMDIENFVEKMRAGK